MKREDIFREIRMGIYWIMSDGLNDDQERECDKILSNLKFIEPSGHFICSLLTDKDNCYIL